MGTDAKDGEVAGDEDFRHDLFAFTALKVGAGVDCILARPAGGTNQGIESVGVRALVRIRDHLATERPIRLSRVGDSPFDHNWIERYFQLSYQFLDLLGNESISTSRSVYGGQWSRSLRTIGTIVRRRAGVPIDRSHGVYSLCVGKVVWT